MIGSGSAAAAPVPRRKLSLLGVRRQAVQGVRSTAALFFGGNLAVPANDCNSRDCKFGTAPSKLYKGILPKEAIKSTNLVKAK